MTLTEEQLIESLGLMIKTFKDRAETPEEQKAIAVADCAIGLARVENGIRNIEVQPWVFST